MAAMRRQQTSLFDAAVDVLGRDEAERIRAEALREIAAHENGQQLPRGYTRAGVGFTNQSTSREAAEAIMAKLALKERHVYLAIMAAGAQGACSHELEGSLHLPHTSVSPRITGLKDRALIRDTGIRRKTPSGRNAIAWVVA